MPDIIFWRYDMNIAKIMIPKVSTVFLHEKDTIRQTGCHSMKTRLKLFFKWGIQFEEAYSIEEKSEYKVKYADCC